MKDVVNKADVVKEFIKLFGCIQDISDIGEWVDVCETTVNEIPSIKVEQDWIPVSEGLPEENDEYIVTMGKDGFNKGGHVTWAMFNKLKKGFYFPTGRVDYYIAVTAWMPRPKSYKGGDSK